MLYLLYLIQHQSEKQNFGTRFKLSKSLIAVRPIYQIRRRIKKKSRLYLIQHQGEKRNFGTRFKPSKSFIADP